MTKASGTPIKKPDLEEFRALLLSVRAQLRGDVDQLRNEALGTDREDGHSESKSPTHMAELGSEAFEQDFALTLVENEEKTLEEINVALAKVDQGTFGLCEMCLEAGISQAQSVIPKQRLKAIPYARNCVECERKRELQ